MKEILGLTGQTGSGKSTARKILKNSGYAVIDADSVSHDLTDTNIGCIAAIAEHFSCFVLNENGKINRKALAKIVFSDPSELKALNKIMFPYLKRELKKRAQALLEEENQGVVIDGAVLIESGVSKICTATISVIADEKIRLNRIMERDGLSIWDAGERISAQNDETFYTESSDYVIKNEGSLIELEDNIKYTLGRINEKRKNAHLAEVM